jgi:hypothetical protein
MEDDPKSPSSHTDDPMAGDGKTLGGEPDTLPVVFCRRCQIDVRPEGKGVCPRCRTFLRLNFVSRRHPVNKLRVEQHLEELIAEFRPSTTTARRTCEHLAGIYEQLEGLKPGSTEWGRLVTMAQTLATTLEGARVTPIPTDLSASLSTPAKIVARLEHLLAQAKALRDYRPPVSDEPETVLEVFKRTSAPARALKPTPSAAPSLRCPYCNDLLSRCDDILQRDSYGSSPWESQHMDHPQVRAKLAEQAALRDRLGWSAGTRRT